MVGNQLPTENLTNSLVEEYFQSPEDSLFLRKLGGFKKAGSTYSAFTELSAVSIWGASPDELKDPSFGIGISDPPKSFKCALRLAEEFRTVNADHVLKGLKRPPE